MKCLIFDLDQTLVDSQCVEHLRRLRQWAEVYQKIPTIFAYEGIDRVLSIAKEKGIRISIVSSSPSSIEAANRLNIPAKDCWTVGDHPNDIKAARRAGMFTIGAEWGSIDRDALRREKADISFNTVSSFYAAIYEKLVNR